MRASDLPAANAVARRITEALSLDPLIPHGVAVAAHLRAAAAAVDQGRPLDKDYLKGLLLMASRMTDWHQIERLEDGMRSGAFEPFHAVALEIMRRTTDERFTAVDVIERYPQFTLKEIRTVCRVMAAIHPEYLRYRHGDMLVLAPLPLDLAGVTRKPRRLAPDIRAEAIAMLEAAEREQGFYRPEMREGCDF